jgi:hypothetical protein
MSIVERKSHQNISYVKRERIKNRQKIICSYNFVQYCIRINRIIIYLNDDDNCEHEHIRDDQLTCCWWSNTALLRVRVRDDS